MRLEHGAAIDRRIPSFLLDSWISRAGFAVATAFGIAWGGLWSTGEVERHGELLVFRRMPRWTHGRGGTCVGRCYLTFREGEPPEVLAHELVHVRQWRRYGLLLPILYLLAGRDPLRNRFEIEAGLEDGGYVRPERTARPRQSASRR
ncbi:Fe-S oxidoreductase [Microbacterium sediminis]|uniref:Fe-S oxidoreductase n=1 Tax=Microbacterium sediminis TaxID=904291 RepID=A0A1B9N825_9MICO|nr:Fe-S oxidoreductase [Microbacterium sediminis]QBR75505.1 Fe-S oxidoreductase [Microbacterium sediminis]